MRELKFRVWNIKDKVWDDPTILEVWDGGGVLEPFQYIKSGELNPLYIPKENYVIQQFTGLQDVKGNNIYEGDIVKFENDFTAEVIWCEEDAAFQIRTENKGGAFLNERYMLHFKVIGNIFENADLLKKI